MTSVYKMVPSLLCRLQDDAPAQPTETSTQHLCTVQAYKASVVRDLEMLVNTRQRRLRTAGTPDHPLAPTVFAYGLPDFTALNPSSASDRQNVTEQLSQAITHGDRRFSEVKVSLPERNNSPHQLVFHINALLNLVTLSERVNFEAVLHVSTQHYYVRNLR